MSQRNPELAVSTIDLIYIAMSIEGNFRGGDRRKLMHWVYEFMKRRGLSVRTRTRESQTSDVEIQSVKQDFCRRLMTSYNNTTPNPRFLVNMDETAVYLNFSPNCTVYPRRENRFNHDRRYVFYKIYTCSFCCHEWFKASFICNF